MALAAGESFGRPIGAAIPDPLAGLGNAIQDLPAQWARSAGMFLSAGVNNVGVLLQRQIVALAVAAVVLLVLFYG